MHVHRACWVSAPDGNLAATVTLPDAAEPLTTV